MTIAGPGHRPAIERLANAFFQGLSSGAPISSPAGPASASTPWSAPAPAGVIPAQPPFVQPEVPTNGVPSSVPYQSAPSRFEAGTGNIADAVGLGAAIDYLDSIGMEPISRHEHELIEQAIAGLRQIPGLRLIGAPRERAGVVSFVLDGIRTEDVGRALDREGIAVRAGHHCAQPILRRFGLESTVRPSFALYNTSEDVKALIAAVRRIALETVVRLPVPPAARRRQFAVLRLEALYRRPRFNQRAVDREMIAAEQALHPGLIKHGGHELAVLVAGADHQQSKTDDVRQAVRDLIGRARIDHAGGEPIGEARETGGVRSVSLLPKRKRQFAQRSLNPVRLDGLEALTVHARRALVGAALRTGMRQKGRRIGTERDHNRRGEAGSRLVRSNRASGRVNMIGV